MALGWRGYKRYRCEIGRVWSHWACLPGWSEWCRGGSCNWLIFMHVYIVGTKNGAKGSFVLLWRVVGKDRVLTSHRTNSRMSYLCLQQLFNPCFELNHRIMLECSRRSDIYICTYSFFSLTTVRSDQLSVIIADSVKFVQGWVVFCFFDAFVDFPHPRTTDGNIRYNSRKIGHNNLHFSC